MKVPLASILVRGELFDLTNDWKLTMPLGTTYSCVANYEGTNVEISMLHLADSS